MNPRSIYELLLDRANEETPIEEIMIGLTWTYCRRTGSAYV